jgi:hypothetical protein
MACLRRIFTPGQIDKVAIRQFKTLPVGSETEFATD